MPDAGQPRERRVVEPSPTRTEEWLAFAADVRRAPEGVYLDASEVAGEFPTVDAAKSLAWRINHGRAVAFRPAGCFYARTSGCDVSVTYVGHRIPDVVEQEAC